jgi:class 3 adenylate cyclase
MLERFVLLCDASHIIYDCDPNALRCLRATSTKDILNQPITRFMSKYIANIHEKHLFGLVRNANKEQLRALMKRLLRNNMSKACRYVMYTTHGCPFMCRIEIDIQLDEQGYVNGFIVHVNANTRCSLSSIRDTIPTDYKCFIGSDHYHVQEYDNVTCIMMDVCESTDFVRRKGGGHMAAMLQRIYEIANSCVIEMYPFVYVHELIGDCVFVIAHAPFMVKTTRISQHVAIRVACVIQTQVDTFLHQELGEPRMYLRVGIATGPVTAGVIDGRTFRLFGTTVHRAQRLESICERGCIATDYHFHCENAIPCTTDTLKGFDRVDYFIIDAKSYK